MRGEEDRGETRLFIIKLSPASVEPSAVENVLRAAPNLLYACRVALAHIEMHHCIRGDKTLPPGSAKTCKTLRDAIAKAEGEGAEK